jgi:hypothetical protein
MPKSWRTVKIKNKGSTALWKHSFRCSRNVLCLKVPPIYLPKLSSYVYFLHSMPFKSPEAFSATAFNKVLSGRQPGQGVKVLPRSWDWLRPHLQGCYWRPGKTTAESTTWPNPNDPIGNRIRDLSACSTVPQPAVPPRTPVCRPMWYIY